MIRSAQLKDDGALRYRRGANARSRGIGLDPFTGTLQAFIRARFVLTDRHADPAIRCLDKGVSHESGHPSYECLNICFALRKQVEKLFRTRSRIGPNNCVHRTPPLLLMSLVASRVAIALERRHPMLSTFPMARSPGISSALTLCPVRETELVHQRLAVDRDRRIEEVGLDVGEIAIEHGFALVL